MKRKEGTKKAGGGKIQSGREIEDPTEKKMTGRGKGERKKKKKKKKKTEKEKKRKKKTEKRLQAAAENKQGRAGQGRISPSIEFGSDRRDKIPVPVPVLVQQGSIEGSYFNILR